MSSNSVLAKLAVQISANTAQFISGLSSAEKGINSFTSSIKQIAGSLGVAFGVKQIADFTVEVSRLSGEAEAVSAAFRRLPDSVKLMSDLKRATGGTVSELDLMKRAVQASNFDISLKALPRLLEFATLRAQQTGQSVDYLVDSIVTGIGRKSKLILDNLGISAVQLTEALGGASAASSSIGDVADAVGRIAEANLKNMEKFAENTSTKLDRLSASWENLKKTIGDEANGTGVIGSSLNVWTNFFDALSGDKFVRGFNELVANGGKTSEILERFASAGGRIDLSWQELMQRGFALSEKSARKLAETLAEIQETQKNLALASSTGEIDPSTGLPTSGGKRWDPSMAEKHIESLNSLKEKEEELLAVFAATDATDKKKLENRAAEILSIRAQIKAIEDLLKVQESEPFSEVLRKWNLANSIDTKKFNPSDQIKTITDTGDLSKIPVDIERMEALAQKMLETRNASQKATTEMTQHWIDLSSGIAGAISEIAEGLGGVIVGVGNFGDSVLRAFAGFAKEFGSMLIASGVAALALQTLITNPFTAIAAGTALVALAGAATAAASRSQGKLTGRGPGVTPSELKGRLDVSVNLKGDAKLKGSTIYLALDRDDYRRGRMG